MIVSQTIIRIGQTDSGQFGGPNRACDVRTVSGPLSNEPDLHCQQRGAVT